MNQKEKHTVTLRTSLLRSIGSLSLVLFFFFMVPGIFAAEQASEKVYTAENGKVVFTVTGENSLTITEGKITATPGNSIKLLPGTHIKNGEQLAINIADKDCQETVAKAAAREREEMMLATIARQQETKLLPRLDIYKKETVSNNGEIPVENSAVGQQSTMLAAVLVTAASSQKTPAQTIEKRISIQAIHNLRSSDKNGTHNPACSWGDRADTVKVMRC